MDILMSNYPRSFIFYKSDFSLSVLGMVHGRANMNALFPSTHSEGKYISFEVQQQSTGVAFFPAVMVHTAQLMVHQPNPITHLPTAQKSAAHCCL